MTRKWQFFINKCCVRRRVLTLIYGRVSQIDELQTTLEKTRQANLSSAQAVTGMKVKVEKLEQVVQKLQVEVGTGKN